MKNSGFGKDIRNLIIGCAMANHDDDQAQMLSAYRDYDDSPGLIVTADGKFLETLSGEQLLQLSAQVRITRADRLTKSSTEFTEDIVQLAGQLSNEAYRMNDLAQSLHQQAAHMTDAAQNVAVGAAQSAAGLQDVNKRGHRLADALEQLSQVSVEAQIIRQQTHRVIDAADPQMKALSECGAEISQIIDVIHNVGKQTNYLALNAQIEALRQNSHNSGFVAVAGEIKQLATQTRASALAVTSKAENIGKTVDEVMFGHGEISRAMDNIDGISDRIETAVKEQSATGFVIAGFVEQAAIATADISQRATDIGSQALLVQAGAKDLNQVSNSVLDSTQRISERSRKFVNSIPSL